MLFKTILPLLGNFPTKFCLPSFWNIGKTTSHPFLVCPYRYQLCRVSLFERRDHWIWVNGPRNFATPRLNQVNYLTFISNYYVLNLLKITYSSVFFLHISLKKLNVYNAEHGENTSQNIRRHNALGGDK